MASLSPKRLSVYLFLIGVLSVLWLSAEFGVLPEGAARKIGIFKPPKDTALGSFSFDSTNEDEKTGTPVAAHDPFEEELRRLAARSGGDSGEDGAAAATPVPTVQPTAAAETVGADGSATQQLDPDDGRSVFSDLSPEPSSQVTDPLGGVVIRGPGAALPVVTPDTTPSSQRGWVSGQARGYTMLYAMQPEARQVVEANVQALLGSRVRQPHIGVLIDGTFGRDFGYLKDIITRLSADGRALTLVLYLSNGPTMRKWNETPMDQHIFARISPEEFRLQIRRNVMLRAEFLAVVLQAKDVFSHSVGLGAGNTNLAVVMLEDNLDVLSYRALREIATEQLGSIAGFVRNPCVKCRPGNDDNTLGDPREEHELGRFGILKSGDGYSLDGVSFRYPNGEGTGVTPEQLVNYLNESVRKGLRYFGLWREEWQGVKNGIPNKRPEQRTYLASSPDQQAFEIDMLRTGLIAESSEEDSEGSLEAQ
jgi:hypothetical protein